jgi:hypothetical protein
VSRCSTQNPGVVDGPAVVSTPVLGAQELTVGPGGPTVWWVRHLEVLGSLIGLSFVAFTTILGYSEGLTVGPEELHGRFVHLQNLGVVDGPTVVFSARCSEEDSLWDLSGEPTCGVGAALPGRSWGR